MTLEEGFQQLIDHNNVAKEKLRKTLERKRKEKADKIREIETDKAIKHAHELIEKLEQAKAEKKKEVQEVLTLELLEEEIPRFIRTEEWDYKIGDPIEYFEADKSYELTGYKPINKYESLDFDPSWFTKTREVYLRTGHYCEYLFGSKAFADFWTEQYKRCKYGMTVNGYTITGDHYFFLNFYQLKDLVNVREAGGGRQTIFPNFLEGLYEWFHYLKMARVLRLNALMLKARSMGYSEIEASILINSYNCIKGSINVACAYAANQLDKLLEKVWAGMSFLNEHTDGGFFKSRQAVDTQYLKRASQYRMINGQRVETGWMSQIQGVVVDKPGKLRGDRTDLLVFEEAGLHPGLTKAYTQSDALVGLIGMLFGLRLIGGTGGESGAQVEGLRTMYYNPQVFGILPFKHNYTQTGEETVSAFFVPAFKTIKETSLLDKRGWISEKAGREYFDRTRALKSIDPKELVTYCAEYCYTAEEAFSLEGDNKFNKVNIAELLTNIRALKKCPPIDRGYIEYSYKEGVHNEHNISGFRWIPNNTAPIKILEHPIWLLPERKDVDGNVIWKPPKDKVRNLYVIGIDGIDIGKDLTSEYTKDPSDFCLLVYKRVYGLDEPKFVAIYKDRPNDVRECYKIAIKLALYYNAVINIEATRLGIIPYARERKLLNLFMRRPRATLSDLMRNTNKLFGTPATAAIISHLTDLIADYVNDYCHNIWFDEMLDELNRYTDENKRKFDIVASMAMCMLADEELLGIIPKEAEVVNESVGRLGYYTDELGRRRYGIIPTSKNLILYNNDFGLGYDNIIVRTSDPRVY